MIFSNKEIKKTILMIAFFITFQFDKLIFYLYKDLKV